MLVIALVLESTCCQPSGSVTAPTLRSACWVDCCPAARPRACRQLPETLQGCFLSAQRLHGCLRLSHYLYLVFRHCAAAQLQAGRSTV